MKKNKTIITLIILLAITVFISGCTSDMPYDENRVTLEINFNENLGSVEVEGEEIESGEELIYESGTDVNLEAIPNEGAEFENWSNINETDKEITVLMDEDLSLVAEFSASAEVLITVEHELEGEELESYMNKLEENVRVEELFIELIQEDETVQTKIIDVEDFADDYTMEIPLKEEATYDIKVEFRGSFIEDGEASNLQFEGLKTFYEGAEEGIEIEPGTGEPEIIETKVRPRTVESLTVRMESPDGALEELDELKLAHASSLDRRKAIKDYVGDPESGEVIFENGNIYNGVKFEMMPGSWDLSLIFEDTRIDVEKLILLPREEKIIELIVYREDGELVVELAWDLPPSAPENVTAEEDGDSIKINWESVDDAESYNIVRREPDGRDYWTSIGEIEDDGTEGLSYIDNDVIAGVTYRYGIVAVDENGLTSDYGESDLVEMTGE